LWQTGAVAAAPLFVLWPTPMGVRVRPGAAGSYLLARGYAGSGTGALSPAVGGRRAALWARNAGDAIGLGMVDYVLGFVRHPSTVNLNLEFMPPYIRTLDGQAFSGLWCCGLRCC